MKNETYAVRLKKMLPLEILVGILILMFTFFIAFNADIASAQEQLAGTVGYMKEQCNNAQMRDLASEGKSLLRVTESMDQIRWRIVYGIRDSRTGIPNQQTLQNFAKDSYLDGLILLDKKGEILASCDFAGLEPEKLLDQVDKNAVLDVISFKEKTYTARIVFEDESHVDLAAVGRSDRDGILVGYYYTSAEYAQIFNNTIRSLVSGYSPEHDGTIVISSGDRIVASNVESLVGQDVEDVPILRSIMERGTGEKLIHTHSQGVNVQRDFGLMDKSQNYYIYAYMPERKVFATTLRDMLYVLFAYLIVLAGAHMLLWKTEQTWQQKQMASQQEYTKMLEEKNEQLKEAAAQAQRANRAKSDFLSRMSHDIRTPLNGIIGLLKIDVKHFEDKTLVLENHQKMMVSANHLLSLINDVLQMGKLEDGKIELRHERIDLVELSREIGTIIEERTTEAGIKFNINVQELPYVYVYGSPVHLRQIFLNVYGNCIKYNRRDGSVSTSVVCLGVQDNVVTYQWTISDTGIGMKEAFLSHIFEPFAQERSDARSVYLGTGLGMAIVKGLLEQMHGTIDVASKEGVGSTFVITIPFEIAEKQTENADEWEQEKADISGKHLLLAEDNDLNAEIAETFLKDAGAFVTTVSDGKQAVEAFQKNAPGSFDAILMDIMMPVMDGLTATKTIRALDRADAKTIPIIAMTANAFEEDAKKCLAAGMNAHIAKPIQVREVVETIVRECRGNKNDGRREK